MRLFISIIISISFGLLTACNFTSAKSSKDQSYSTQDSAFIVFANLEYDFGIIKQGEQVACVFSFENQGQAPLIIQEVKAGCGCTNIKYPQKPIRPEHGGALEVTFNSRGRNGIQRQSVRVYSNSKGGEPIRLIITANVQ